MIDDFFRYSAEKVTVFGDGKELYIGGPVNEIDVCDSEILEHKGKILIPGGSEQMITSLRVVQR